MSKYGMKPTDALSHIRIARSLCEPNEGFMQQLELYYSMHCPQDVEDTPAYQRWMYQREVALSRACGQAPDAGKIRFEDEYVNEDEARPQFELRCRKCRYVRVSRSK